MNKISLITLSLLPTTISPIIFSNIYYQAEKLENEKEMNNQLIDWTEVTNNLDNMFENISYEKNKDELGATSRQEFDAMMEFIKQKNNSDIKDFKNNNLNLNQLNDLISNKHEQFKLINQNPKKYFKAMNLNHESNIKKLTYSNSDDLNWLKNHVYNLKIYKTTFATISATAAVAAAGFWAAAWWFGITAPWAVGCTLASSLTGAAAGGITIALSAYDKEMNKWIKAGSVIGATSSLGFIFYKILSPIFVGLSASATALSWAFPSVLAVVGISIAVLSWISLYK